MKIHYLVVTSLLVMIVLAACKMPAANLSPDALDTIVAATFRALTPSVTSTQDITSTHTITTSPTLTSTPTLTATTTKTITPSKAPTSKPGSISGGIYGYPYGSVPSLSVVAFKQGTPYYWYWITGAGNTYYSMAGYVSPGTFQVVAYDSSGHAGGCTTIVTVVSEQAVTCDITDWAGSYPPKPGAVP